MDRLYEILTSKAYFEQRFEWGKVNDYRFQAFQETGEGLLIQIVQPIQIRTDKVPSFARRLLPSQADLLTEFVWQATGRPGFYQRRYRFQLGNVRLTISGTPGLSAAGASRSIQDTQVEATSWVTLVGRGAGGVGAGRAGRMVVVNVIEDLGYTAHQAADARTALPLLGSDLRVDLLVTDVGLPGMNGRQLAEIARQYRPELKVLFMTGYAEKAAERQGFLEDGMDMVAKPFSIDLLATKIRSMISVDA